MTRREGGHHQRSRECIVPAFSSFDYDNAKTAVAGREEGGGGCVNLFELFPKAGNA